MGLIEGDRSVEIDAPIARCYEIAADIENAPDWQGSLKDVEVLERDGEGRALVVETDVRRQGQDGQARSCGSPTSPRPTSAGFRRRATPSRSRARGSWRTWVRAAPAPPTAWPPTRAECSGCFCAAPPKGAVRDFLLSGAAEGLKEKAEGS